MPVPEPPGGSSPPLAAEAPEELSALAALAPVPRRWERLAWYCGAVLLTCLLIFFGLRLDRAGADLTAPFYYDLDALLILPLVKATQERGFGGHWRNERMGAPGILELHDFPVIDHLHFFILWLLGKVVTNLGLLFNLYFLLTFPLTTLTGMIAFRHLGLSLPAAAVGGLLYSFLPYHYHRWENHYFLAAYWLVPLSLLPVLAVCRGDFLFFAKQPDGTYRRQLMSRRSLVLAVLGAAVASAGAYYAFFTCALLGFAGCYGWWVFRTWRATAGAGVMVAVIVTVGVINHLPTLVYQAKFGRNPVTDRFPEEADTYGLKITHLVLPINDHNLRVMNALKVVYLSGDRPAENENQSASLGLVGTAGLIGLVVMVLLPGRRPWPYGPLSSLAVFTVLLATVGGFGSVFNLFITAQIRGYNRISVFLAFLCLFAVLWAIDRFLLTRTDPRARRLRYPAWAVIFVLGFLDQTPYGWFGKGIIKSLDEQADRFRADAEFFHQIEERMPPGARIFCLPYAAFPERPPQYKMGTYEHARGYIHTQTLAWSFGAMKGREADAWQIEVAYPLRKGQMAQLMQRLVAAGFDGVLIDNRGFPPPENRRRANSPEQDSSERLHSAAAVAAEMNAAYARELNRLAKLPEVKHPTSPDQFFLDLRPYRDAYRARNPDAYRHLVQREQDWVAVIWLGAFFSPEDLEYAHEFRYGPPDGTAMFINPSDRDRKFRISMTFGGDIPGVYRFRLSGLVDAEFEVEKKPGEWERKVYGQPMSWVVTVPPGRHALRIRCTPPADLLPSDHRKLCYYMMDFRKDEIP